MIYGKIPPNARDLEDAVLGAILLEKQAFDDTADILKPEVFYVDRHQLIYQAFIDMANAQMPIDLMTLTEYLRKTELLETVGGPYYLVTLTNSVVSAAHIETHSRILLQKFISRELIRISGEIISAAYEDFNDAFDLLDWSEQKMLEIGAKNIGGGEMTMQRVMQETMSKIEKWRTLDTTITGIPSGFKELDMATRGWQEGDLIILAARPSVGKTAFMLNLVKNAAEYFKKRGLKESVAVWSLEMKAYLLGLRLLAAESERFLFKLQTGRMEQSEMDDLYNGAVLKLSGLDIIFDEDMGINTVRLRSKIRRLVKKKNLKIVFIDYLQLVSGGDKKNGTREQEISGISRSLKLLAQELNIPIIALSQMSRDIEKRKGEGKGEPMLSDIRESGGIEQDADVVMFLYGPTEEDIKHNADLSTTRYIKIAKQRNGVLLKSDLNFRNEIQLFKTIEDAGMTPGNWKPLPSIQSIDYSLPNKKNDDDLPF